MASCPCGALVRAGSICGLQTTLMGKRWLRAKWTQAKWTQAKWTQEHTVPVESMQLECTPQL